ncbi:MAG TPA: trehalose-phosphatase [Desulfobacterales bacterium]|nr:trehalose-phosphatase [Desulfobacterales bacterium]
MGFRNRRLCADRVNVIHRDASARPGAPSRKRDDAARTHPQRKESVIAYPSECIDLSIDSFRAAIFDLDGVVTDTAALHARAWKQMFDAYLAGRKRADGSDQPPFDAEGDYRRYVDGRPRYDGVEAFLRSRGIALPEGDPQDAPEAETVCGLGNRKNAIFQELIGTREVKVFDATVDLIRRLRSEGVRTAIVSSSKNCRRILEATDTGGLFDVRVDGIDAEEMELAGKPSPAIFLEAARRLDVAPEEALVVEDALSGVEAGQRGGFACVIGVDRSGQAEALQRHGADVVVADLADVSVGGEPVCEGLRPQPLPEAGAHIEQILAEADGRQPAIFLDYDGTLTPIVRRPQDADLSVKARRVVWELAREMPVAVVSGRDLKDVMQRVGLAGLYYAGSHGFDIHGPGERQITHQVGEAYLGAVEAAEKALEERLSGIAGVRLERKKFSIAVHYRETPEDAHDQVAEAVETVADEVSDLRVSTGKKVFDLQPDIAWDKGRAVRWLMENALEAPAETIFPIYIGDDVTDEDAFRALQTDGIGIRVEDDGAAQSAARYRLKDPEAVHRFLQELFEVVHVRRTRRDWRLCYDGYDPDQEKLREALCTLGNGYLCTRGAAPESEADEVHYPGTYLAGGYNRLKTEISGRIIENEDLVNMPNWLPLNFRIEGGPWFSLARVEVLDYRQELDVRNGALHRRIRFRDDQGRVTRVVERRMVSLCDIHLAGLETTVVPENWSGVLEFRTGIDGRVVNAGVARYRGLNNRHLLPLETAAPSGDTLFLEVETNQSKLRVAMAARTRALMNGRRLFPKRRAIAQSGYVASLFEVAAEAGRPVQVEKIVSVYTGRDPAISECGQEARAAVRRAGTFERLFDEHRRAWYHIWRRFEMRLTAAETVEDGSRLGMIVHLYIFHVLQTTCNNTMSMALDAGAPARGWHGEAYRGHIFWDELFIFPMISLRLPEITKCLLMYRYRRLDAARREARAAGYRGAMYPWQSGSTGREESQQLHLNPRSGRWIPDRSHRQRHVNAAIAYNLYHYYQVSRDMEFLSFYGAEMMLEIARFWASIATYNPDIDRYEILGVMGPDEYHDGYPGAEEGGLDNNAYTNVMAVWVLRRASEILDVLTEDVREQLRDRLDLTDEELALWADIARKMRLVFHDDGILSQFEGYDDLAEFDWEGYREKYGDIQRLDRILEAEDDTPNRYKASKQADVLMLFYLFSAEELAELFEGLGYRLNGDAIPRNVHYYLQRTSHGSTLSRVVHTWVLSRTDRTGSWKLFAEALESDVSDIQGGTTPEGIHMGAMAGVVDQLQRGYTGIEARRDALWFNPCLPRELEKLHLRLRYRHRLLEVDIDRDALRVSRPPSLEPVIHVGFDERIYDLTPGETLYLPLPAKHCGPGAKAAG